MTETDYTYRYDSRVPSFNDMHPVLVFDGTCVLCSGGAARMMAWDKKHVFRFATAQSTLGHALLEHYGCDAVHYNTVLIIADGRAYIKSDAYIKIAEILGGLWRLATILKFIPRFIRDPIYDIKARNRYNWFGKTGYCQLLPSQDDRIIAR